MYTLTAQKVATALKAELVGGCPDRECIRISTDTRSVTVGDLFVALRGERFDAHDYLSKAIAGDAAALIVDRFPEGIVSGDVALILVPDTLSALQDLATWQREQLSIPCIGITGSNGKTSTKDFTRSILAQSFRVNATLGNLNNHIGLPLTVLATTQEHTAAVFEMGMSNPGEIEPLCAICQPQVGIITNIGTAHIEFMGSHEAIALEKGALARSLPATGTLVIPQNCAFGDEVAESTQAEVVRVGEGCDIHAENISLEIDHASFDLVIGEGRASVRLPVSGKHMVQNALLAAGASHAIGMSVETIAQGLTETSLTSGRLRVFTSNGVSVLDDTYNANPDSVCAALDILAASGSGQKIAVLGKMAELGGHAAAAYETVGSRAAASKVTLVTVGPEAAAMASASQTHGGAATACTSVDEASVWLSANARPGDTVLFKGSRSAGMERVMHLSFPEK